MLSKDIFGHPKWLLAILTKSKKLKVVYLVIQNGRRWPFCEKNAKNLKVTY